MRADISPPHAFRTRDMAPKIAIFALAAIFSICFANLLFSSEYQSDASDESGDEQPEHPV